MRALVYFLVLGVAVPSVGLAAPAISCHCFRDREFDPARPTAADPYILATARNSLLAAAFGVDKGDVVRALMSGTAPDDLWVAHWAAARTGGSAASLLQAKADRGSWRAALAGSEKRLGPAFAGRLAADAAPSALAAEAADEVLVSRLRARSADVQGLRSRGASTQEVVLSTLLAPRARRPPADVLREIRSGQKSWGALLAGLGLTPKGIEEEIRRAIAR